MRRTNVEQRTKDGDRGRVVLGAGKARRGGAVPASVSKLVLALADPEPGASGDPGHVVVRQLAQLALALGQAPDGGAQFRHSPGFLLLLLLRLLQLPLLLLLLLGELCARVPRAADGRHDRGGGRTQIRDAGAAVKVRVSLKVAVIVTQWGDE